MPGFHRMGDGWPMRLTRQDGMRSTCRHFRSTVESGGVSTEQGGNLPVWSHDGKQLFFIGGDGRMTVVDVKEH